jgi:plastocyanin
MKAFLLVLLLAAPLLAGCATQTTGPATPPRDAEGRYVIKMTSALRFVPADAAVPANATVVWVLDGTAPHDVTEAGEAWSSDEMGGKVGGPGGPSEYQRTFAEKGTVRYYCKIHGTQMSGTLTVQ